MIGAREMGSCTYRKMNEFMIVSKKYRSVIHIWFSLSLRECCQCGIHLIELYDRLIIVHHCSCNTPTLTLLHDSSSWKEKLSSFLVSPELEALPALTKTSIMPASLLSLPLSVRQSIYEHVWCHSSARIVAPVFKNSLVQEGPRFPEAVEARYPPPEDKVEDENDEIEDDARGGVEAEVGHCEDDADGSGLSQLVPEFNTAEGGGEDASEVVDNIDDDEESAEPEDKEHGRRYALESFKPLDIALLSVNRQIHSEALPVFYANTTFVLDSDGEAVMRFLRALPDRARNSINSITLTGFTLNGDDAYSRRAWSGKTTCPKYAGPPTMVTPFGAFLASRLPALEIVSFYFPFGGGEDWYCTWAPTELLMLLWHRRISLLNFVFLGDRVAATLKECSGSDECYETLMGDWGEDAENNIGEHLFELGNPAPEGEYSEEFRQKCQVYFAARDKFAAEIDEADEGLIWEWGNRTLEMGSDGNVQAVVSMWMTAENDE